jgi:hypothetical protein
MHSISWPTLLASAVVALATTLLVEYLAKPWLEARKDRILDKGRQHRTALNGVKRSTLLLYRLMVYRNNPQMIHLMNERIARVMAEVEENMLTAFGFMNIPQSVGKQWDDTTSALNAYSLAFPTVMQNPPDDYWTDLYAAFCQLRNFEMLLSISKWHVLRRRKLVSEIKSFDLLNTVAFALAEKTDRFRVDREEAAELWQ